MLSKRYNYEIDIILHNFFNSLLIIYSMFSNDKEFTKNLNIVFYKEINIKIKG